MSMDLFLWQCEICFVAGKEFSVISPADISLTFKIKLQLKSRQGVFGIADSFSLVYANASLEAI